MTSGPNPPLTRDFLEHMADTVPEKVGLVSEGQRLTYSQIEEIANQLAFGLGEMGVRHGDRVALHLDNSITTVAGIFAILKLGAVFVPINPKTKRSKLHHILNNCRATAAFVEARTDYSDLIDGNSPAVPSLKGLIVCGLGADRAVREGICTTVDALIDRAPSARPSRLGVESDLACLIYTSGSTGDPKGVMSDHSNIDFATSAIIECLQNTSEDIVINPLPLAFDYGLYQLLMTFKFGGTLVLEKSFTYPAEILNRIEEERVTGLPGVPTIFSLLLSMDLSPHDLSSLRYITNTAAALPVNHIEEIRSTFPHATLHSMYGLTETKRTLYLPPGQLDQRPGSVGIPLPGTEAWLEDDAGRKMKAGEIGQLVVRGRHVMRGYWEAPEKTAQRFRTGTDPANRECLTGDLFRQDDEGYFYFVGRKDDIIKSRGEKVPPKEVEGVLYALPGVLEVAVIGVADDILGQAIKAFVVVENNELDERRVLAHCRKHLEDFMVPKHVEFPSQLPKTASGKISKTELK